MSPRISVFLPAHNEAGNIAPSFDKIARAFTALKLEGQIIFVDDGSTDSTWDEATGAAARYPCVQLYRHRLRLGKTEALRTGLPHCKSDVVMLFDADLESDPEEDIPKLWNKIHEGYDVVAGWRQGRRDGKIFASAFANAVSRRLFGLDVHDINWIKAFRREVIENIRLRSDWHRYLLILAAAQGYKIAEVPVNFYPRTHGKSKYGVTRLPISFLDVIVLKFLLTFSRKPMQFFGGLGLLIIAGSIGTFAYLAYLFFGGAGQRRPIFDLAGVLLLVGVLLFVVGFLAELIVNQSERVDDLETRLRSVEETSSRQDRGS